MMLKHLDQLAGFKAAEQHHAVHPLFFQRMHDGQLALRIFLGIAQKDVVSFGACHMLGTAGHVGKKRVGDIGNHQTDGSGMAGSQTAGDTAGTVAQSINNFLNALACCGTDFAFVIDDPGDGHHGNARLAGDVCNGHVSRHKGVFPVSANSIIG
jgi:hypothetical protein